MAKADTAKKRRQPPVFRHLSSVQAKKAKQAWVEKAKLRSKWKAERRKLVGRSLISPSNAEAEEEGDEIEKGHQNVLMENDDTGHSPDIVGGAAMAQNTKWPTPKSKDKVGGRKGKEPKHIDMLKKSEPSRGGLRQASRSDPLLKQEDDEPSLRELFRKAYSRGSLHTYKSDPLHRGKHGPNPSGEGRSGKGQPNMKLRMNALLEKIKRDVVAG